MRDKNEQAVEQWMVSAVHTPISEENCFVLAVPSTFYDVETPPIGMYCRWLFFLI